MSSRAAEPSTSSSFTERCASSCIGVPMHERCAEMSIDENGLLGPGVQLLTVSHPLRAADRMVPGWAPGSGRSPYRNRAAPITISCNVWIGAATLVMPGVTIGDMPGVLRHHVCALDTVDYWPPPVHATERVVTAEAGNQS